MLSKLEEGIVVVKGKEIIFSNLIFSNIVHSLQSLDVKTEIID